MAKKSLLTEIEKMPDAKAWRRTPWHEAYAAKHPDDYADLLAVLKSHRRHDVNIIRKLPTKGAFCDWMIAHLATQGVNISFTAAKQFYNHQATRDDS